MAWCVTASGADGGDAFGLATAGAQRHTVRRLASNARDTVNLRYKISNFETASMAARCAAPAATLRRSIKVVSKRYLADPYSSVFKRTIAPEIESRYGHIRPLMRFKRSSPCGVMA